MRIAYENELEARTAAAVGAFGVMVLLFAVLFLASISSTMPNPPPVQFVEVNFGTTDVGSGSVQTFNKPDPSPRAEDVKKSDDVPDPKVTTTPRVERTPVAPVPKIEEAKPSKTIAEKPVIATKAESPVTVPEKVEATRLKKTVPTPTPAPPRAEPAKKVETVDPSAIYKKSSGASGSNGTNGRAEGVGGNNDGDNRSGVGDKGNPEGNINAKEFYGKPGGASSGVALNVSGWAFGSNKLDKDESDESGKIIFQIRVDSDGSIVSARPLQTTVSPDVVEFYKRQVLRFKLRPKGSVTPSDLSVGTLTVSISAN
jgi:periplasmic protein TonB